MNPVHQRSGKQGIHTLVIPELCIDAIFDKVEASQCLGNKEQFIKKNKLVITVIKLLFSSYFAFIKTK